MKSLEAIPSPIKYQIALLSAIRYPLMTLKKLVYRHQKVIMNELTLPPLFIDCQPLFILHIFLLLYSTTSFYPTNAQKKLHTFAPCVRPVCATTSCTCDNSLIEINLCEQIARRDIMQSS